MEKPTLKNTFNFPFLLDLGPHSTTKNTENPAYNTNLLFATTLLEGILQNL